MEKTNPVNGDMIAYMNSSSTVNKQAIYCTLEDTKGSSFFFDERQI